MISWKVDEYLKLKPKQSEKTITSRGILGKKTSIDLTNLQEHGTWSVVSLGHSNEHTKSPHQYRLCYGGHLGKWRTKFCFS